MLANEGFLKKIKRREESGTRQVYAPNQSQLENVLDKDLLARSHIAVTAKPWFRSFTGHEDIVRTWGIRLQRLFPEAQVDLDFTFLKSTFVPSNGKKGFNSLCPDIVLKLESGDEIFFEVELTQKDQNRYFTKFMDIISKPNRSTIYLVKNEKLNDLVLKILPLVRQNLQRKNQSERSTIQTLSLEKPISDGELIELIAQASARHWMAASPNTPSSAIQEGKLNFKY
jgi:hypothetical protein